MFSASSFCSCGSEGFGRTYVGYTPVWQRDHEIVDEQKPCFWIKPCFDELVFLPFAALVALLACLRAKVGGLALIRLEEVGVMWGVGQGEEQEDRPSQRDQSEYYEEPLPRPQPIFNVADGVGENASEDCGNTVAREPDAAAQSVL